VGWPTVRVRLRAASSWSAAAVAPCRVSRRSH